MGQMLYAGVKLPVDAKTYFVSGAGFWLTRDVCLELCCQGCLAFAIGACLTESMCALMLGVMVD